MNVCSSTRCGASVDGPQIIRMQTVTWLTQHRKPSALAAQHAPDRWRGAALAHHRAIGSDVCMIAREDLLSRSEQPLDLALVVEADDVGGRDARKARHGHDLAGDGDNELGAG